METKHYTLKQAADLLGMTKPGVRYHLKAMGEAFEKDAKGQVVVSESVLQRIRDSMKPESTPESSLESGKSKSESVPESDVKLSGIPESVPESDGKNEKEPEEKAESAEVVALEVLREQCARQGQEIERLNAKIEEKDRRIDELTDRLTEALVKAQILHAASAKMLQDAVAEDSGPEPEESEKATLQQDPPQKKRGLWARLFGRD